MVSCCIVIFVWRFSKQVQVGSHVPKLSYNYTFPLWEKKLENHQHGFAFELNTYQLIVNCFWTLYTYNSTFTLTYSGWHSERMVHLEKNNYKSNFFLEKKDFLNNTLHIKGCFTLNQWLISFSVVSTLHFQRTGTVVSKHIIVFRSKHTIIQIYEHIAVIGLGSLLLLHKT